MLDKLKKSLVVPLPLRYRQGFASNIFAGIYKPTMVVGLLIAAFEAVMMAYSLAFPGLFQSANRLFYFSLYLFLFVVTLAVLAFSLLRREWLRRHPGVFIALSLAYGGVICLWGSLLSAYSHRTGEDISVFLYVTLCTAVVLVLRPWQALLLYGGNQAALLVFIFIFRGPGVNVFASVINSTITSLLAMAIASLLYRNRVRDYINRITIVQQNREIQNINKQLRQLVYIDDLTKANNRRYLDEVLPGQLTRARRAGLSFCVLMFDLDHFKQYNDLYGHQAGDHCLIAFAGLAQAHLAGKAGAFVRYGGEEFILCLEGADEKSGMKAAEAIRQALVRQAIPHGGDAGGILTVSIGVRISPPDENEPLAQLVSDADQALYIAKNSGRNRAKLFYSPPRPR